MSEILPNYTLYVKNLNDRIKKEGKLKLIN